MSRKRKAHLRASPKKIDGQYTFYGIYCDYKQELSRTRHWTDKTVDSYDYNFENCIGPYLSNKPIGEYTSEEIYREMSQIQFDKNYGHSKINTLLSNIRTVYSAAVEKGLCPASLWGTEIMLPATETPEAAAEKELIALQKSLDVNEEIRVFQQVYQDVTQAGENFGVALMFALGLRNAEACAVNFADIRPMEEHPDCSCLWIYKTTGKANKIKASGKTKNADRIIPLPQTVASFLLARREYLENLEKEGQLLLNKRSAQKTVMDLPIACVGTDYNTRCTVQQLSVRGKEVLRDAKVNAHTLGYIDASIRTELLKEKEATAYLFRRNFATQLYILGFDESEIQYLMGHGIEDTREKRNYFNNEAKLYPIKLKMDSRALLGCPDSARNIARQEVLDSQCGKISVSCAHKEARIKVVPDDTSKMLFHMFVHANEPNQSISIKVNTPASEYGQHIDGLLIKTSAGYAEGPARILSKYYEAYRKKILT